jgi:sugar phosphate permease
VVEARPRYRWAVLAIGVAAQSSFATYSQGLAALGPVFRQRFAIDLVQTGALLTAVNIGVALTLVAWGVAADRFGERLVLFIGLVGAGVALAGAGFARSFPAVFAFLVASGMLGSCANAASGRAVMAWFGPRERGTALGVRQMGTPLGGAIGAAALPLLSLAYGFTGALLSLAAISAAAGGAAGTWLKDTVRTRREPPAGPHPVADARIWRLALGGALLVAGQLSMISYLVIFLNEHRRLPLAVAAGLLAGVQLGGAAARVAAGRWSDLRRARIGPMLWIAVAMVVAFVLLALTAEAPLALLVPVLLVTTVLSMSSNGLAFTATGEIAGLARSATAMGFQNTALFVSGVFGPIAFAAVVSRFGWQPAFVFLALLALAGWLVLRPLLQQEAKGWRPLSG